VNGRGFLKEKHSSSVGKADRERNKQRMGRGKKKVKRGGHDRRLQMGSGRRPGRKSHGKKSKGGATRPKHKRREKEREPCA